MSYTEEFGPAESKINQSALVLGATGLVGSALVTQLLGNDGYRLVRAITRRPMSRSAETLDNVVTDFDALAEQEAAFAVDHVFCCLGTTIKKAGSRPAFEKVDHDYVVEAARLAADAGAGHFLLVTAVGADARSAFFYNRVKGRAEQAVMQLPLRRWSIVRPSLLLGDRQEARPLEQAGMAVGRMLSWTLRGPLQTYRPVEATDVADTLVRLANDAPLVAPIEVRQSTASAAPHPAGSVP